MLKIADRGKCVLGLGGGRAKRDLDSHVQPFSEVETHLQQVSGKIPGNCHGRCLSRKCQGCIPALLPYQEALWV